MKKPWETWVLKGLSINEAAPMFEKMERIQMEPWGHTFGWKHLTLADGRKVKLTIQKNGPVPVYTAIAESSGASTYRYYLMDSGFVQVGAEDGAMWQTSATNWLYLNYSKPAFALLGPTQGVSGGSAPPSFKADVAPSTAYADKVAALTNQKPGNYTGKLRWLLAGQYGLYLDDPSWLARNDFTRYHPAVGRTSGEGVYTANDGTYWHVLFEDAYVGPNKHLSATATKLVSELEAKLTIAGNSDERRQLETHLLALATKTDTVLDATVTGSAYAETTTAEAPMAYGWHFNRDGSQAAIVCHEFRTVVTDEIVFTYHIDVTTHKYTADLQIINPELETRAFNVTLNLVSTHEWQIPVYVTFWQTYYDGSEVEKQNQRYPNDQTDFSTFSVPIHCFYDQDDVLQDCLLEFSRETIPPKRGDCWPQTLDGYNLSVDPDVPERFVDTYAVVVGAERHEIVVPQPYNGLDDCSFTYVETPGVYTVTHDCSQGILRELIGYTGPCEQSGITDPYIFDLDGFGNAVGCQTTETITYIDILTFTAKWTEYVNEGAAAGLAIVFPLDEADAIAVLSEETTGGIRRRHTLTDGSLLGPSNGGGNQCIQNQSTFEVVQCSDPELQPCSMVGTYASPTHRQIFKFYGVDDVVTINDTYDIITKKSVFSREGAVIADPTTAETDDIFDVGAWASWFFKSADYVPSTSHDPIVVEVAETGACKFYDSIDTHLHNDFPENADLVVGWA